MTRRYKGILAKPIRFVGEPSKAGATTILFGLRPDVDAYYEAEISKRRDALFKLYGLDPNELDFAKLAAELCRVHVPGFSIAEKHASAGSNPEALQEYQSAFIEVERVRREKGISAKKASEYLARHGGKGFANMKAKDIENDYYAFHRYYGANKFGKDRHGESGKDAWREMMVKKFLLATPRPTGG